VWFWNEWSEAGTFSWKVLEAAPALEMVRLYYTQEENETPHASGAPVLQCLTEALRNSGLQRLEEVRLGGWILGDNDLMGFADALEESGCATQLVNMTFIDCEFSAEGCTLWQIAFVGMLSQIWKRSSFLNIPALRMWVLWLSQRLCLRQSRLL
jgi:hypothetical protein